jgi:hypothetical protein
MHNKNDILGNFIGVIDSVVPKNKVSHSLGDRVYYYHYSIEWMQGRVNPTSNVIEVKAEIEKVNSDGTYDVKHDRPPHLVEKSIAEKYLFPI